jgi:hypothetical protein
MLLGPFGEETLAFDPAEELATFERTIKAYRDARKKHTDFKEFVAREGTTCTAEADHDHAETLERMVVSAQEVLAGQALVVLSDGLLEHCAEIIAIETAGRP